MSETRGFSLEFLWKKAGPLVGRLASCSMGLYADQFSLQNVL